MILVIFKFSNEKADECIIPYSFFLSFVIMLKMEEQSQTYTLDEALEAVGFGKFQIFVLGYAGMGLIAEAMEMMLLSFVGPAVQSAWGLSPRKESYITSVVFAGMLVGAYSWGIVSDKHGRRQKYSSLFSPFEIMSPCFQDLSTASNSKGTMLLQYITRVVYTIVI